MKLTVSPVPSVPAPPPAPPEAASGGTAFAPVFEGVLDEHGMTPTCTLLPPDGDPLPDPPVAAPENMEKEKVRVERQAQPSVATCGFRPVAWRFPLFAPDDDPATPSTPQGERDAADHDETPELDNIPALPAPVALIAIAATMAPNEPIPAPASAQAGGAAALPSATVADAAPAGPPPPAVVITLPSGSDQDPPPAQAAATADAPDSAPPPQPSPHPVPQTAEPTTVAPAIQPALQAFGAAMRKAAADEREPATENDAPAPVLAAPTTAGPSGAQSVAPSSPALDIADRRWPHAMAEQIERLRDAQNESSTRIRLLPDALGPINVAVRRDGAQVHVHFTAAQAETRQLLLDAQPHLADAADARGLKLGRTEVSAETSDRQQQRQPAPAPQSSRPAPAPLQAAADPTDTRIA